jgi:hypothetical protein
MMLFSCHREVIIRCGKQCLRNNRRRDNNRFYNTKDSNTNAISLEEIMGSTFIELDTNAYALYIPSNDLLRRSKYNWFCKLNSKEVLEANTILSKYLLLSNETEI